MSMIEKVYEGSSRIHIPYYKDVPLYKDKDELTRQKEWLERVNNQFIKKEEK